MTEVRACIYERANVTVTATTQSHQRTIRARSRLAELRLNCETKGFTMSPLQQKVLGLRLADGTDDERQLNERLVAIGGDILCLPLGPNPESENGWVSWLLEHGQLIDGPITLRRKGISGCHQNVATIWRRKQHGITGICSGYGLSDDGLWRAHTWGLLPGGGILETTIAREKYFGLVHEGEMADDFADMTLEGEKSMIPRAAATRRPKKPRNGEARQETTAQQFHDYMSYRAQREGMSYELTVDFFQTHMDAGCLSFFGVKAGPHGLKSDSQQPELFKEWRAMKG